LYSPILNLVQIVLPRSIGSTAKCYFSGYVDFDFAMHSIHCRSQTPSFNFFKSEDEDGEIKYHKSKSAIRGNDVYRWRVLKRHRPLIRFCEVNPNKQYILKNEKGYYTNIIKCTLTPDIKLLVVSRTYESGIQKTKGYIHINVIIILPNNDLPVFHYTSKKRRNTKGKPIESWRLQSYDLRNEIADMWACGFVDIRAIKDTNDLIEYSLKYYIKEFTNSEAKNNQSLTMGVLSLYNKRGYSFPRASTVRNTLSFEDTIIDYTASLDDGDPVNIPLLDIQMHNSLNFTHIGHIIDYNGDYSSEIWFETIDKPPDHLNPDNTYHDSYQYVPAINSHDYGYRKNEDGVLKKQDFIEPKFTIQKKFRQGTFYNKYKKWKDGK